LPISTMRGAVACDVHRQFKGPLLDPPAVRNTVSTPCPSVMRPMTLLSPGSSGFMGRGCPPTSTPASQRASTISMPMDAHSGGTKYLHQDLPQQSKSHHAGGFHPAAFSACRNPCIAIAPTVAKRPRAHRNRIRYRHDQVFRGRSFTVGVVSAVSGRRRMRHAGRYGTPPLRCLRQ